MGKVIACLGVFMLFVLMSTRAGFADMSGLDDGTHGKMLNGGGLIPFGGSKKKKSSKKEKEPPKKVDAPGKAEEKKDKAGDESEDKELLNSDDDDVSQYAGGKGSPKKPAGTKKSVKKALKYLAESQGPDGSWNKGMIHKSVCCAVTSASFAGLAFLSSGHTVKKGKYKLVVRKALAYVVKNILTPDPLEKNKPKDWCNKDNWRLSIGGMFLAEVYACHKNSKVKATLQEVIKRLEENQEKSGGWAHGPGGPCSDGYIELEVMSNWALATMGMAGKLKLKVNGKKKKKGLAYIAACFKCGGIAYSTRANQSGTAQPGRTGGAMLALALNGKKGTEVYKKSAIYLSKQMSEVPFGHASPAMHFFGAAAGSIQTSGTLWEKFVTTIFPKMIAQQKSDGSFKSVVNPREKDTVGDADGTLGAEYTTGIFALIMTLDEGRLKFLGGRYAKK